MSSKDPKNRFPQPDPSSSSDECGNSTLKTEEEKIQQDRYKVFIEDVADGFYEVDLQGNFTFFNDALSRIFGYPNREIKERNYREFMDQTNADIAFEAFNQIYRTGKGVTDIKWVIDRKDGERRYLEISANLITADDGGKKRFSRNREGCHRSTFSRGSP